jgi:regulatory protein
LAREKNEERFRKAQQTVYRLLKFRLRSEKELQRKLSEKKLPRTIIKQTIRHFEDLQLINDRTFAQQWISSRLKKPFGINRIRLELREKGIAPNIVEEALNAKLENYDEFDVVLELAQYRASKYKNDDPQKTKQRIYGYLLRRGFSPSNIIKAINTL